MKKNTFFILMLSTFLLSCDKSDNVQNVAVPPTSDCLPSNLQNGAVAFYTFGNGSLNDRSGNNHDLTNTTSASATIDRDGNPNCAFGFNQSNNEFLEAVNSSFLDNLPSTGMSISFWYKANNDDMGTFISRDDTVICDFTIGQWSVNYLNAALLFGANGALSTLATVHENLWEHVVVTLSANTMQVYQNGVLIDAEFYPFCTQSNPTSNIGKLFIGKMYDGAIDDIVIYDRIINTSEVNQLYALPACCN